MSGTIPLAGGIDVDLGEAGEVERVRLVAARLHGELAEARLKIATLERELDHEREVRRDAQGDVQLDEEAREERQAWDRYAAAAISSFNADAPETARRVAIIADAIAAERVKRWKIL